MTDRPVPFPRGEERLFFDAARQKHLAYQQCDVCGTRTAYPRTVCPSCLSDRLTPHRAAGTGVVHSFTTLHRAGNPAMRDRVPYTVVLVDLDEGVRLASNLVGVDPADVAIGMPVEVAFVPTADGMAVPVFTPRRT